MFNKLYTKLRKKILWDEMGDFESNSPKKREKAIKEYIHLSKPTMRYEDFMQLPIYNRDSYSYETEYRVKEKKENKIDGYTLILHENNHHELKSYRFI